MTCYWGEEKRREEEEKRGRREEEGNSQIKKDYWFEFFWLLGESDRISKKTINTVNAKYRNRPSFSAVRKSLN